MNPTYKATLRGDKIIWRGDIPELPSDGQDVAVQVTILDEPTVNGDSTVRGPAMAAALEKLAAARSLNDITDPVAWQRDQRRERILPDRD